MWSPVYLEMKKRINIKKEIVLKEKLDAKKKKLVRAKMFIDFPTSIYLKKMGMVLSFTGVSKRYNGQQIWQPTQSTI